MALNVAGLEAYVDQEKLQLIKRSILGQRAINYLTVQPDIKSSAAINIIDSTIVMQAGACGWNPGGTTTLTQREIEVKALKINEAICLDTLEKYWTQKLMNPGSFNENIPFEQIFAEEKADKIGGIVEDILFRGDIDNGSGNLALVNGFLQVIDAEATVVDGNTSAATSITAANVVAIMEDFAAAFPTDIVDRDDLVVFVGFDVYRLWTRALRAANLFHYDAPNGDFELFIPGTNVKVVATRGLNGTNRIIGSYSANLYVGTDLLNEFEDFKIFYDDIADDVKFRMKGKLGVQVAFPEHVVEYTNAD